MRKYRNRKIRILFPFVGDSIGGAQISCTMLIKELDKTLYDPIVVLHESGPLSQFLKDKGIEFQVLPLKTFVGRHSSIPGHLGAILGVTPKLFHFLLKCKIDIVHAQDSRANLTWVFASLLARKTFIWHQRSRFSVSGILSLGARVATHIVCISDFTRSSLPEYLKKKSSVIVNPVDTSQTIPDRKASRARLCSELNIDQSHLVIGFFGNLTLQKRPEIAVRIAAELSGDSVATPVFVIFGADRSNLKNNLIKLANTLDVASQIIFKDFVINPETWMAGCDIIIAPGVEEGFGRTVIEAMLVGTPVVAANSGGHVQIIRDWENGVLVSPDNISDFSSAIKTLNNDKSLAHILSKTAREEVVNQFGIEMHVAAITNIYQTEIKA
jgi:glycosyltransferase involved in cell wall biosynthesis